MKLAPVCFCPLCKNIFPYPESSKLNTHGLSYQSLYLYSCQGCQLKVMIVQDNPNRFDPYVYVIKDFKVIQKPDGNKPTSTIVYKGQFYEIDYVDHFMNPEELTSIIELICFQ